MNERDGLIGNSEALGYDIVAILYLLVCCIGVFSLKGRDPKVKSVEYDSDAPNIHLEMVPLSLQHLRSDVIRCPTDRPLTLPLELQLRRQSEIPNFDIELSIYKDIAQFEVPVNDPLGMYVFHPVDNAQHEGLYLGRDEIVPYANQLVQRLVFAKL